MKIFNYIKFILFYFVLVFSFNNQALAEEFSEKPDFVIGVEVYPPFTIRDSQGNWSGIAVDLWRLVAEKMSVSYVFHELTRDKKFDSLLESVVDLQIGKVIPKHIHDKSIDFSVAYQSTGLGVLMREPSGTIIDVFSALSNKLFLFTFFSLVGLIILSGTIIWISERKENSGHYALSPRQGIASGVWWSIVTLTTVGYGDKSPTTFFGRTWAVILMVGSLFLLSTFTASLTSALTVKNIKVDIVNVEDLSRSKIGVLRRGAAADFLKLRTLPYVPFENHLDALTALKENGIDLILGEKVVLQYILSKLDQQGTIILPLSFEEEFHAFALRDGFEFRKSINQAILSVISSSEWQSILAKYK